MAPAHDQLPAGERHRARPGKSSITRSGLALRPGDVAQLFAMMVLFTPPPALLLAGDGGGVDAHVLGPEEEIGEARFTGLTSTRMVAGM